MWLALAIACADGSRDGAWPTVGEFDLLTYNVHGLPEAITGDDTPWRMTQISPLLNDFDIAGIQEDWDPDNHTLLAAQATHETIEVFDDKVEDSRVYGSGLAVFSRIEPVEIFTEHYTACNGTIDGASDCFASKGFMVLRLPLGRATVDLYDTHLDAGGGDEDALARASNIEQIVASLDGRSAGRAAVFVGDTNLDEDDEADLPLLQALQDAGLRDACDAVICDEPGHIDRLMVRDSENITLTVEAWVNEEASFDADGVPLSDHPAISATIGWSTE